MTAAPAAGWAWVDAHVHFQACFGIAAFLEAARGQLARHAREFAAGNTGMLLLTECCGERFFERISGGGVAVDGWDFVPTEEPESLLARSDRDEMPLVLVAGRQLQTREGLEVLALGCVEDLGDGLPLADVIDAVRDAGALPVVPWGFGKWWFRRGTLLARELERQPPAEFFLGDNGGRPALSSPPRAFARAAQRGVRILPGSDPLPFGAQVSRPGSYGFRAALPFDRARPWGALASRLREPDFRPIPFGVGRGLLPFVGDQLAMQLRKRWPARLPA